MSEIYESLKGFTDLPIAVISLILGILSNKKQTVKGFSVLFFLISASAVLGAVAHIFAYVSLLRNAIWIILYPLLFETVRRVGVLFYEYLTGSRCPSVVFISIAEAILAIGAVITMLLFNKYDMLFLIAFGIISIVRIVYAVIKSKRLPAKFSIILISSTAVLLLQAFSKYIPYAVVWEHTVITVLLIITYFSATEKAP